MRSHGPHFALSREGVPCAFSQSNICFSHPRRAALASSAERSLRSGFGGGDVDEWERDGERGGKGRGEAMASDGDGRPSQCAILGGAVVWV